MGTAALEKLWVLFRAGPAVLTCGVFSVGNYVHLLAKIDGVLVVRAYTLCVQ